MDIWDILVYPVAIAIGIGLGLLVNWPNWKRPWGRAIGIAVLVMSGGVFIATFTHPDAVTECYGLWACETWLGRIFAIAKSTLILGAIAYILAAEWKLLKHLRQQIRMGPPSRRGGK